MLVLALAEANHGSTLSDEAERQSKFPICDTEARFGDECKRGCLRFVADKPRAEIKGLQPYQRGDEAAARLDPLAILRDLSDFDKHRRLPLIATFASVSSADVSAKSWQVEDLELSFGGPLEAKTELARHRGLRSTVSGDEVEMDIRLSLNVAFADTAPNAAAGNAVYSQLSDLWRYIGEEVIPHLQPYLPDTPAATFIWPPGFQPKKLRLRNYRQQ